MKTTLHFSIALFLSIFAVQAEDEFFETLPDGSRPTLAPVGRGQGEGFPSNISSQPTGVLSGRIVYCGAGHGWTWSKEGWYTQRGVTHEMNEDYGNLDQLNHFVPYLFNAGATVVPTRPVGYQTNEIVLDNDSPDVKFSGQWFKSQPTVFYGSADDVPYQFAPLSNSETATATYTPKLPVAGFYPVYTWARHGPDRTNQLYRILHTGGETHVRVPHHMVGSGWVFLGIYYFNAGASPKNGAVIISNLQPTPSIGSVAVADAIRFGNGMGDFIPDDGAPKSSYPREEEGCRYWIARSLGQGQSEEIYNGRGDDQSDNVGAPIRMAREMNRETAGDMYDRIYISFHSNAGGGRGATALWNNPKIFPDTKTPNQERLAELMGSEINDTLSAFSTPPLEVPWHNRSNRVTYARNDYAFGEINNKIINDEFDATMAEVAFHDHKEDAKLLRDPKVRDIVGRCAYRVVIRYLNEFDKTPLHFLPAPPRNVRAVSSEKGITISWEKPEADEKNEATAYVIYRSENGYGFGNPIRLNGDKTAFTLPDNDAKTASYFRIAAVNEGGESLPSEVVGCRVAKSKNKILFVNGFTQFDRFTNPRQTIGRTNYVPLNAFGRMERVIPRRNNAFDYVVRYGEALAANGVGFDSCSRESIAEGAVSLRDYQTVIWATGNQFKQVLTPDEQKLLTEYRRNGGNVFLSGAHIVEGLATQFDGESQNFLRDELHVFPLGGVENSALLSVSRTGLFNFWKRKEVFGHGEGDFYFVARTDNFSPIDDEPKTMLQYTDDQSPAAIRIAGGEGEGKLVYFAFPFETLASEKARKNLMADVLKFFGK